MSPRELPDYLQPVPDPDQVPAEESAPPPEPPKARPRQPPPQPQPREKPPKPPEQPPPGPPPTESPRAEPPRTEPPPERPPPQPQPPARPQQAQPPPAPPRAEPSTPGLIPPQRRGHSGGFLADVIAELGFASSEQVQQAITQARTAGHQPEALLLEQGVISAEQLSRAVAEHYGQPPPQPQPREKPPKPPEQPPPEQPPPGPPPTESPRAEPPRTEPPPERPPPQPQPPARPPQAQPPPAPPRAKPSTPGLIPPQRRGHSGAFLADVIAELGFASSEQVQQAITQARTAGHPPEALLLEQGAISAEQLSRAVAERYGLDFIDLAIFQVDMAAANLISVKAARRLMAVPVGFVSESTLQLAIADPTNVVAIDDVQMATGFNCVVAVAPAADIEALVGRLSTLQSTVAEAIADHEDEDGEDAEPADVTDIRASAEDAPVIKLVNSILGQAVTEGASDIHFEPQEGEMRIRFRLDGVLREAARVPKRMVAGVVSRVKIMSELDIAEKRMPQDGRVAVTIEDHRVDLRVTTLPTQKGEAATIRILDGSSALRTLDELGMTGAGRTRFESAFSQAYGAVLVTGPTGSGKSTTLYAALQSLNEPDRNIVTIEDPVEYQLQGVNQIGVQRKAGLDFATGLRSVLRADPDVIMVGEVRDAETARIAIEAAMTGHMLLTTLHTNDAPGAITRLTEMGIESFLTSSAVDCVVAQRLARLLCPGCKNRVLVPQNSLAESGFRLGADLEAYEAVGCQRCFGVGYRGRVGIYSVMALNERIKDMIVEGASEAEIGAVAREEGMRTLREAGLEKVRDGVTSIEEVVRVAS